MQPIVGIDFDGIGIGTGTGIGKTMAQSTMILPFSILTFATPISFSAVMISCRLALREKRKWMSLPIFA